MTILAHWYKPGDNEPDGTATALCGYTWTPDHGLEFDEICEPCVREFLKQPKVIGFACNVDEGGDDGPPERTQDMIANGQVWAWMNGPGDPHWEVRGTGLVADDV